MVPDVIVVTLNQEGTVPVLGLHCTQAPMEH